MHATLVTLCGAMWSMGFEALALPHRYEHVISEHHAIADAIRRDPESAATAAQEHIRRTAAAVLRGPTPS